MFTSSVQSESRRLSAPIENWMTKLEIRHANITDINDEKIFHLMNSKHEVVNKEHEQQWEYTKPITGTIASNAQGNHLHEATQMFTPIKVAKDIKIGELGEEMFDDIAEA